jgi:hypothetical protein
MEMLSHDHDPSKHRQYSDSMFRVTTFFDEYVLPYFHQSLYSSALARALSVDLLLVLSPFQRATPYMIHPAYLAVNFLQRSDF